MSKLGRSLIKSLRSSAEMWEGNKGLPWYKRIIKTVYLSDWFDYLHNPYCTVNALLFDHLPRTWAYAKLGWQIKDWDYNYTLQVLRFSLERLHNSMLNGVGVYPKTKRKKMLIMLNLLKRMNNSWESYNEKEHEYFEKKWGKRDLLDCLIKQSDGSSLFVDPIEESLDGMKLYFYNTERREYLSREDKMFKQDMDLFCKIFSKHIRKYWD